ncbi:hypothetical protein V2J09_003714 [Rumex salicifolius]
MSNVYTRSTTYYNFSKYSVIAWFLLGLTLISWMCGESAAAVPATKGGGGGGGGGVIVHPKIDVNYMSNRRVPKGPDPIHNRRASNSRRPPGKA